MCSGGRTMRGFIAIAAFLLSACSTTPQSSPAPPAPGARSIEKISQGGGPYGVAVSSAGVVYVTALDIHQLGRYDLPSHALSNDPVQTNLSPTDVAFTPDGSTAFIASAAERIGIVELAANRQYTTIPIVGFAIRVLVSPDGSTLYATTSASDLLVMNIATKHWTTLSLRSDGTGLAFDPMRPVLYVSTYGGTIYEVNRDSNTIARSFQLAGRPRDVAVSPDGERLFIANEGGELEVRSTTTLERLAAVKAAEGAFGLAASPDGKLLYVTRPSYHDALILDAHDYTVLQRITGGSPRRVAFDPSGTTAIITNGKNYVLWVK